MRSATPLRLAGAAADRRAAVPAPIARFAAGIESAVLRELRLARSRQSVSSASSGRGSSARGR